jgi:hypothetical protein
LPLTTPMVSHLVMVHHLYLPAVAHQSPFSFVFCAQQATYQYFNPSILVVLVATMLSSILASIAQHNAIFLLTFVGRLASTPVSIPVC